MPILGGGSGGGGSMRVLGAFHGGGDVTKDGAYLLKKGEKVISSGDEAPKRDSEYRRVYVGRQKKKS